MTLSDFRRITDELLSAYIDDEVTEQERALIEAAIVQDEEIAWRLDSLRQTVSLLHDLPELVLPRSFTLTLEQLAPSNEQLVAAGARAEAEPVAAPPRPARQLAPEPDAGFWQQFMEGWRRFWQGGNPMLRNAAAVSFAMLLFLTSGGQILTRALTQPAGMTATAYEAPAAAPAAQSVAIAPTATEAAILMAQDDTANKAPVDETETGEAAADEAPAAESPAANARIMQAPAESAESAADAPPSEESTASVAVARVDDDSSESEAAVAASEAAVAEAAPAGDAPVEESAGDPEIAAAMAAPEQPQEEEMPPLVANPLPGGGAGGRPESGGGGGGMGGGGPEGPMGGGTESSLFPEQEHNFDVNPVGEPTPPAEDAVAASVAAAPVEESAEASVADMAVTPAVDAVEPEAELVEAATASEAAEGELAETENTERENAVADNMAAATAAPTAQAVAAASEPTATPEAVALVAPGAITSSEIVAAVNLEGTTPATGLAGNLPVVWIAQSTAFLLTIVLASLWWRSRSPRRR